jgi:hypothetical protein
LQPTSPSLPTLRSPSSWPTVTPIRWRNAGILGNIFYRAYEVAEGEEPSKSLGKAKGLLCSGSP